jgi:hypothetical protein
MFITVFTDPSGESDLTVDSPSRKYTRVRVMLVFGMVYAAVSPSTHLSPEGHGLGGNQYCLPLRAVA